MALCLVKHRGKFNFVFLDKVTSQPNMSLAVETNDSTLPIPK